METEANPASYCIQIRALSLPAKQLQALSCPLSSIYSDDKDDLPSRIYLPGMHTDNFMFTLIYTRKPVGIVVTG
jgi:hypothetical protein